MLLTYLPFAVITLHLLLAPYSKVEESFHTQAVHDTLYHLPPKAYLDIYSSLFLNLSPLSCSTNTDTDTDYKTNDNDTNVPSPPPSTACALLNNFDHLSFPGVVPRSFLPSALISNSIRPILRAHTYLSSLLSFLPAPAPPQYSTVSRFVLGMLQAQATVSLSSALPSSTRSPFLLLSCIQPHLNFYASRFLPNSFALLLTTHSFSSWFGGSPYAVISLLTLAAVMVRCDMLILAAPVGISLLLTKKVTLVKGIFVGALTVIATFAVIVPLDTVMWNNYSSPMLPPLPFLWAEGVVLFYNTIENKSANWGTSPFYWYLIALVKALLGCFVFALLGVFKLRPSAATATATTSPKILSLFGVELYLNTWLLEYLLPAVVFVALYSLLPHKELRFILPAFPIFNVAAAEGLAGIWSVLSPSAETKGKNDPAPSSQVSPISTRLRRRKVATTKTEASPPAPTAPTAPAPTSNRPHILISGLIALASVLLLLFTVLGTATFLAASHHNYPGGEALAKLHSHILSLSSSPSQPTPKLSTIFIDNYAAMSGISRFQQVQDPEHFQYVKEGYEASNQQTDKTPPASFTHLVCADECASFDLTDFHLLFTTSAYDGFDFRRFSLRLAPKVFVYERK
ncbi:hypothetical protein TrVE_jg5532 [Triparma verrucosa]|uniref:Mannosyltransferase n=1 Tax=Triparma verrucosa TaxID=1606542 RepID=A0A9W7BSJ8_9STRA|nr:hypothetical protein TrVE_jg5532 [Triparma verrucosa]